MKVLFTVSAALLVTPLGALPKVEKLQDGLQRQNVASQPLIQNPVDVSVDVDGTIYAVETTRRKAADLDIRQFRQWIPASLAMKTVEDRRAFLEEVSADGRLQATRQIKDQNKDGKVDIEDLTVLSERIHRLRDTDGDGVADETGVFAEGFNTPVTGVAAGLMAWRGDVFATIVPDVWRLRDTSGDGKADQREAIATGFGVQIAYAGHDMHGIQWGPDGKLYWTIGDKGASVLSKEGKRFSEPVTGALFRCKPDGTEFEVVARGLRNVQQFAFDDFGNIIAVDNDADFSGEKERLIMIPEGSDTGWRIHYQYRGKNYNPWMEESMDRPEGKNQPAYIFPALETYYDGPSGFARDPGTALNERYRGSYFMTSFPAGILYSFKLEPEGASFKMTDSHQVDSGPSYVGCSFGPDGSLYLADWRGGYALNQEGAIWRIGDPDSDSELKKEVAEMLRQGPFEVPSAELVTRLGHQDQRIRCDAQWELATRPEGVKLLLETAKAKKDEPLTCTHALWGLVQAGIFHGELFAELTRAEAEQTRAQAAKWAGDTAKSEPEGLAALLADPSPVVRYQAGLAIGKLGADASAPALLEMIAANGNADKVLSYAGAFGLAGLSETSLAPAFTHESAAVRLAAAVAARRTKNPQVATLLGDPDPDIVSEAARSIYDEETIPAALPQLALLLEKNPSASEPALRRAIAANRRLATAETAARLVAFAVKSENPSKLRLAALEALGTWTAEVPLDLVDGRALPPTQAAPALAAATAFLPVATALQQDPDKNISVAASKAIKNLGIKIDPATLAREVENPEAPGELRLQALLALQNEDPKIFRKALTTALTSKSPLLRSRAAPMMASIDLQKATNYGLGAVEKSSDLAERQAAVTLLASLGNPESLRALESLFRSATELPELQLELLAAAEQLPELKKPAKELTAKLASEGPLGPYLPSVMGGDPVAGQEIFKNHLAAQCTACHRVGKEGSAVGPPLTEIGKKDPHYLLESLVLPQAVVAPGYGLVVLTLKDGSSVTGNLSQETDEAFELAMPDATPKTIPKSEVQANTEPISTMPPMSAILTSEELRDLNAYLGTLKGE